MNKVDDITLDELADNQAASCRVLGNGRRLLILWLISNEELSVNEITHRVGSSIQNISQHLRVLKESGIIVARRKGQTIYYRIADLEWTRGCPALHRVPGDPKQT